MLQNLLLYRFIILNICIAALGGYAIMRGWAAMMYAGDSTYITTAITVLFAVGWLWMAREILAEIRNDGANGVIITST